MNNQSIILGLLLSALASTASAHGVWVSEHLDTPTIVLGEASMDEAYDTAKVRYVQAFDNLGNKSISSLIVNDSNVTIDKTNKFSSVAVLFDHGYWSQKMDGKWVNQPKTDFDEVKYSTHAIKTNLSVLKEGQLPSLAELKTLDFVIYPVSPNLYNSKIGDEIEVIVLYKGKPLANVEIGDDFINDLDHIAAITDDNGIAKIKVRNNGLNVFAAAHKVKAEGSATRKSENISYEATLSFDNFSK